MSMGGGVSPCGLYRKKRPDQSKSASDRKGETTGCAYIEAADADIAGEVGGKCGEWWGTGDGWSKRARAERRARGRASASGRLTGSRGLESGHDAAGNGAVLECFRGTNFLTD
jgi:hypothetical protein